MRRKKRRKKRSFFQSIGFVVNILSIIFLAFALSSLAGLHVLKNELSFFGFNCYIMDSDSMQPGIHSGSFILTRVTPPNHIAVNDIITYRISNKITTQRVIEIIQEEGSISYITKADKTDEPNAVPVTPEQIIGVHTLSIGGVGSVMLFLRKPLHFAFALILIIALFLIPDIRKILKKKTKPLKQPSA
ncbi:MAG: signal peptidase I [Clostridiales bacterium]|jgi:signal peptidase|nr:signal peptidase I [Clostridiales bacterium]